MMVPIGRKKFQRIVRPETKQDEPRAEFLPLDMGAARVLYTENELRAQLAENSLSAEPLPVPEEMSAIAAFAAFWKRLNSPSRAGRAAAVRAGATRAGATRS